MANIGEPVMSRIDEIRARLEAATLGLGEGPGALGDFIANTPSDLAYLLEEVERLQTVIDGAG